MSKYIHMSVKSALHMTGRKAPCGLDLNIYRGCEHGCKYCFALYSHKYLDDSDYTGSIYVKTNIAERLERELHSQKYSGLTINMGGVTDSYQPIESEYKLMRDVLPLLIKYKVPAVISTKSELILRDCDLFEKLARIAQVDTAMTITVFDDTLGKKIEPNASLTSKRFEVLKAFKEIGCGVGVHVMPVMPYLTDDDENLTSIFSRAAKIGADYVLCDMLRLRGETKRVYLDFIRSEYPRFLKDYINLYADDNKKKEYKYALYKRVSDLQQKCGARSYDQTETKKRRRLPVQRQLSLFDINQWQ